VPAYNCADQIGRVITQLEKPWVSVVISQVLIVDNRSTDDTALVVRERVRKRSDGLIKFIRNDSNYGLGGSHKVAFSYARDNGFDWLIVLHGDDQGSLEDFRGLLESREFRQWDCILGSRFMVGSRIDGYSGFRIFGNYVFNAIYSLCLRARIHDLGAGLNMYRVECLRATNYLRHPDNLTFNCVLLSTEIISKLRIRFVPISWREDDQVSNVKLIRQSLQTLRIALRALVRRQSFVSLEHREKPVERYTWTFVDG
jgi:glycosyltransferase involved in cell wall biosynthesis